MITLEGHDLIFRFPEVHEHARTAIHFQRTLRIPDDGKTYPLPPGLVARVWPGGPDASGLVQACTM